jgi:hypothetical protein
MHNEINEAQGQPAFDKNRRGYSLSPRCRCYTFSFCFIRLYSSTSLPNLKDQYTQRMQFIEMLTTSEEVTVMGLKIYLKRLMPVISIMNKSVAIKKCCVFVARILIIIFLNSTKSFTLCFIANANNSRIIVAITAPITISVSLILSKFRFPFYV